MGGAGHKIYRPPRPVSSLGPVIQKQNIHLSHDTRPNPPPPLHPGPPFYSYTYRAMPVAPGEIDGRWKKFSIIILSLVVVIAHGNHPPSLFHYLFRSHPPIPPRSVSLRLLFGPVSP